MPDMVYSPENRRRVRSRPVVPISPPYTYQPTQYPPPPKKSRVGLVVVAVIGVVVVLAGGIAVGVGVASRGKTPAASPTCDVIGVNGCTHKQGNGGASVAATTAAAPAVKVAPDPKGFTVGIKVLRKACFGSAGCNITFRIDPSYSGADFTRSVPWDVVYQVNGGTDTYTNRFTLTGSQASFREEELIQTASSSATLTAVVTDVLPGA